VWGLSLRLGPDPGGSIVAMVRTVSCGMRSP
jgi:hypothetical protein